MRRLRLFILAVPFLAATLSSQTPPVFSGHWRQKTKSGAERQLEVEHNGQRLRVKTVVTDSHATDSDRIKTLEVNYEIGGPETAYTGLDGDHFRSAVRRDGSALVFDTIEQEAGKEIPQKTIWTLSADGNTLQVDRTTTKSGQTAHSLTAFARQP